MSKRSVCNQCNKVIEEGSTVIKSASISVHKGWYEGDDEGNETLACKDVDFCGFKCAHAWLTFIEKQLTVMS